MDAATSPSNDEPCLPILWGNEDLDPQTILQSEDALPGAVRTDIFAEFAPWHDGWDTRDNRIVHPNSDDPIPFSNRVTSNAAILNNQNEFWPLYSTHPRYENGSASASLPRLTQGKDAAAFLSHTGVLTSNGQAENATDLLT